MDKEKALNIIEAERMRENARLLRLDGKYKAAYDLEWKAAEIHPGCQCWNEGQWGRVHREDCEIHD